MSKPEPLNKKLYEKVKKEAKNKFAVWPSAYASGWLVAEYKRRGGKYSGKRIDGSSGISRWFDEKWIDVCKLPKKVPCGRPKGGGTIGKWKKDYPYCRPSVRINKGTPTIASKLTNKQINDRCAKKKSNPTKKVMPTKKTSTARKKKTTKR